MTRPHSHTPTHPHTHTAILALLLLLLGLPARADLDTFRAIIGLDDGMIGRSGTVRFFVELDGRRVLETGVMRPGDPARPVEIPLEGAKELRLVVDDAGDGHGGDWGDWADARLVDSKTGDTLFLSDLSAIVEKEWIPTRMDRNLIQNPLQLNGMVYPRGLGADSGSSMVYRDWQSGWNTRRAEAERQEVLAARKLGARAILAGRPAAGLQVLAGGEAWPGAQLRRLMPGQPLTLIWTKPVGSIVVGRDVPTGVTLAGVPLERLTPDRIDHLVEITPPPFRNGARAVMLGGRRYFGALSAGSPVRLTWEHPLSAALQQLAIPHPAPTGGLLMGRVGLDARESNAIGTARFLVYSDGQLLFDSGPMTARSKPIELRAPFLSAKEIRLVVSDAGDGGFGDAADWADVSLSGASGARGLPLSGFLVWSWRQNWGAPQHDRAVGGDSMRLAGATASNGIGVSAPSEVVYRDLDAVVSRRAREMEELEKLGWVGTRFRQRITERAARRILESMVREDPEFAEAHYALARLSRDDGRLEEADMHLKRLLDVGISAPLALRAAVQRQLAHGPVAALPEHPDVLAAACKRRVNAAARRPERSEGPAFPQPRSRSFASLRMTKAAGRPVLSEAPGQVDLSGRPRELELNGAPGAPQTAAVRFSIRPVEGGANLKALIASAGLEVRAWLLAGEDLPPESIRNARALAYARGRNPTLRRSVSPGRYTLVIEHDPERDGMLLPFRIGLACAILRNGGARPHEEWSYAIQNDGSARVELTTEEPTLALVPFTAERIVVSGARSVTIQPAFAYGSSLETPYTIGPLVLVVPPAEKRGRLSFTWPDAAYDVPASHYATDHARKHFFASIRGVNPDSEVHVAVTLPSSVTRVTRIAPETALGSDGAYHWWLAPDRSAIVEAENPSLETRWISAKHRNMTISLPDTAEYRSWLPRYRDMLARIYDRESYVMGDYQTDEERFLYITGPAQLSGYGGATWADPKISETWIAATGRVGEYNFTAQAGGDGVEAHELKWVHLPGWQPDAPYWLRRGTTIWLEEQGKLAGATAFPDLWTWTELMPKAAQYRDRFHSPGTGFVWKTEEEIGRLPAEDRQLADAMDWYMIDALNKRLGDAFWNRFWKYERENPAPWKDLTESQKTRRVIDDVVKLTGDESVRALFEAWGFGG